MKVFRNWWVVTIACAVGGNMMSHPDMQLKHLLRAVIRRYHPGPFLIDKSSECVEITHFASDTQELVHLIHHPAPPLVDTAYVIDRIEPLETFTFSVRLPQRPAGVYLEQPEDAVEWSYAGGVLHVTVKDLHVHRLLVVDR